MSRKARTRWLKYGITTAICLAIAATRFFSTDFFTLNTAQQYMVLSDCCFIPGILCVFAGLLAWVSAEGGLDAVGYIARYTISRLIPGRSTVGTYKDYIASREEKRPGGFGFLLIVGSVFVVLCVVFSALYSGAIAG